jgi:hypothetical protein
MDVRNDSTEWLVLWLEPLGEDRWLRRGERLRIRTDYRGDDLAFSVTSWVDDDWSDGIENIAVWIENGDCYAEVTNAAGDVVECGHQRPAEIHAKWTLALTETREHAASRTRSKD